MRSKSQIATASIKTPNTALTASIQAPARGSRQPADRPSSNKGAPKPSPMQNSAAPPSMALPVWLIYNSAPAKGGATQGPTITAETAPINAAPRKPPPRDASAPCNLLCKADGACKG